MTKHIREKLDKISDLPTQVGNRLMRVILEEILDEIDKLQLLSDLHEPVLSTCEKVTEPQGVTMQDVFTYDLEQRIKAIKGKSKKK